MTPGETLYLANSLLGVSPLQEYLLKFQRNIRKPGTGQLTESWRKGFVPKHDAYLWTKNRYHANHFRMNDSTEDTIGKRHDITYTFWTAARYTVWLPEVKWHYVDVSVDIMTKGNVAY